MTLGEAEKRVAKIKEISGDDELAHIAEDELREEFIRFIASRVDDIPEYAAVAKIVLSTEDITFERWFA